MKNELIANEKAIVARLSKKYQAAKLAHTSYVEKLIEFGEQLLIEKKNVPHGDWDRVVNLCSEHRFGSEHASRIMRISSNKVLVMEFFQEDTSIRQLNDHIASATPEQLEKVEQLKREAEEKAQQAEQERQAKIAQREATKAEEQILEQVATKEPEPIDAEFTEVKPTEEVKPGFIQVEADHFEQLQDRFDETLSVNESLTKEIQSIVKVFESNDQLTTAAAEIKRLTDINTALDKRLQGHLNGWHNERRELIGTLNAWKRRAEKAEKKLAEFGHGK